MMVEALQLAKDSFPTFSFVSARSPPSFLWRKSQDMPGHVL